MKSNSTIEAIELYGIHAEIIDEISSTGDNEAYQPLFTRVLDAYYIAGLLGLLHNRKGVVDKSNKMKKSIFTDTVYRNINEINFVTAFAIIKDSNMEHVKNVKRALFTDSSDEENYSLTRKRCFEQYVLGGLEIINEKILRDSNGNRYEDSDSLDIFWRLEGLINELKVKNSVDSEVSELVLDDIEE